MPNPHKKFEVEISPVGVWFSEIKKDGKLSEFPARFFSLQELEKDINYLTAELQIWFNF